MLDQSISWQVILTIMAVNTIADIYFIRLYHIMFYYIPTIGRIVSTVGQGSSIRCEHALLSYIEVGARVHPQTGVYRRRSYAPFPAAWTWLEMIVSGLIRIIMISMGVGHLWTWTWKNCKNNNQCVFCLESSADIKRISVFRFKRTGNKETGQKR